MNDIAKEPLKKDENDDTININITCTIKIDDEDSKNEIDYTKIDINEQGA